jgi:hypothetical protein
LDADFADKRLEDQNQRNLRASRLRPNTFVRHLEALGDQKKTPTHQMMGERFNFPTRAFSTLALSSVPGDGLRHSIVRRIDSSVDELDAVVIRVADVEVASACSQFSHLLYR